MVKRIVKLWRWLVIALIMVMTVEQVIAQANPRGPRWPRYCTVQKKYNLTKRVKYRAPTAVRTYEWCFNLPPRCSKWTTEMRELTRLETEERVGEVEICCPGFKYGPQGECESYCEPGKTGQNCDEDCEPRYYGPSCSQYCDPKTCVHGVCEHTTGACMCDQGWEGRSCENSVSSSTTTSTTSTTKKIPITLPSISTASPTTSTTPTTTTIQITTTFSTSPSTTVFKKPSTEITLPLVTGLSTSKERITEKSRNQTEVKDVVKEIPNVVTEESISRGTSAMTPPRTIIESFTKKNIEGSNLNHVEAEIKEIDVSLNNFIRTSTMKKPQVSLITNKIDEINPQSVSNPSTTQKISSTTQTLTTISVLNQKTTEGITNIKTASVTETMTKHTETHKHPTTTKFKPKEIWIRPAQKGESPIFDLKIKTTQDFQNKYKIPKELVSENSTTKTIIVSIIPTSVSASFKKIALSTTSYLLPKTNITTKPTKISTNGFTKPMTTQTSTPFTIRPSLTNFNLTAKDEPIIRNLNKSETVMAIPSTTTNRMSTSTDAILRLNSPLPATTISVSSNISKTTEISNIKTTPMVATSTSRSTSIIERHVPTNKVIVQATVTNEPKITDIPKVTNPLEKKQNDTNSTSVTNSFTNPVTENPVKGAETFDILTEPEHITAVMSDKGSSNSSVDLISVICIAGGLMMAMITVAVIIVMLERCRRPRYDEVRKFNDVSMNVIIDNHDASPPPYVRSIFHTPLPEPPTSEKCHYQPISTLDRNLKQFMRPVVVQTISPIMLENFRGILECHYDHLPRRNHEQSVRSPMSPSVDERSELLPQRSRSTCDLAIEAMKCEAKMDVIDSSTSEPLYAEIPCWRPPSEHAVEVVNLNGEAVTEL